MIKKLPHDQIPRFTLTTVKQVKRHPVTVLVHNVRSLYNVGSIFRTSDAAGIKKLILCGYTGCPPRKEIEKTALGSTASVEWEYEADIKAALQKLKEDGYKIAALEIATPSRHFSDLSRADYPLALIIGNEITGVDDELMDFCDFAIEIPQFGIKQSLNVAVAYGVGIFGLIERFRSLAPAEELTPVPMEIPPPQEAGESEID